MLAAAARMRQTRRTYPTEQPTAYGLPAAAFKTAAVAPAEHSPYWNKKFAAFSKLSKQKAIEKSGANTPTRRILTLRRAGLASRPVAASTVTFLPATSVACVDHVRCAIGYHACQSADLIVLDTIDRLHQVVPISETWVIALLYIVGLGKPITTLDAWIKLRGDVRSPDARRVVINHIAGSTPSRKIQTVEFLIGRAFGVNHPEVKSALMACGAGEKRSWKVVKQFTSNPGRKTKQVRVDSLTTLWEWLQMHRLVLNARGKAKVWCDGGLRCA